MKVNHEELALVQVLLQLACLANEAGNDKLRIELNNKAQAAAEKAFSEILA